MPQPRVSIVTRTKNRPLLLHRAIASVLAQTMRSWEMLIVNDGGEPGPVDAAVAAVAHPAAGRIRVLHHERSHGMEAASNSALSHARGEFVVIHDDDDTWEPDYLDACVAHMDASDPCVGGVITLSTRITERLEADGVHRESVEPYSTGVTAVTLIQMARENMFPPIAFLYRRSALDTVGRYREDLPVLGDWDFNLRFLMQFDIDVIPRPLSNYHIRPAVKSGIYSNTIVGGLDLHQKYDVRLRNGYLRDDMRQGRVGLGFLINMGRLMNDQLWELRRGRMVDQVFSQLRAQGVRQFTVYGAGALGRRMAAEAAGQGFTIDRIVDRNRELWGRPVEGVPVVGLDAALEQGCRTFVIASLTYAREIRQAIAQAGASRGIDPQVFDVQAA